MLIKSWSFVVKAPCPSMWFTSCLYPYFESDSKESPYEVGFHLKLKRLVWAVSSHAEKFCSWDVLASKLFESYAGWHVDSSCSATGWLLIASLLYITLRMSCELFPSITVNWKCPNLPGLLLFAEISLYFLFASLRA